MARRAYKKASGFARRLLKIDPINLGVRRQMIELQPAHARKQMRAKRADLADKELSQAAEWDRPDAPSGPLRIARGLVALQSGGKEQGEAWLREGVALGRAGVAGWFRAALEAELTRCAGDALWLREELAAACRTPPTKGLVTAAVSALGQVDAGEDGRAASGLLLGTLGWLEQGGRAHLVSGGVPAPGRRVHALRRLRAAGDLRAGGAPTGAGGPGVAVFRNCRPHQVRRPRDDHGRGARAGRHGGGGVEVSAVLVDVTPYTFGTRALGELDDGLYPYCFVPIIPRNTPIPVRRSEVFRTVIDDQSSLDVRIYQGEHEDAEENVKIGEFRVDGLSKAPAGNPVILDLALDRDGILQVSAREKKTGLEQRITIEQAMPRYDQAQLDEARDPGLAAARGSVVAAARRHKRRRTVGCTGAEPGRGLGLVRQSPLQAAVSNKP